MESLNIIDNKIDNIFDNCEKALKCLIQILMKNLKLKKLDITIFTDHCDDHCDDNKYEYEAYAYFGNNICLFFAVNPIINKDNNWDTNPLGIISVFPFSLKKLEIIMDKKLGYSDNKNDNDNKINNTVETVEELVERIINLYKLIQYP